MLVRDELVSLHDATLESIDVSWSTGEARIRLRVGDASRPRRVIVATAVRRLEVDRQLPWGFSVSINEVREPTPAADGTFVLEIEVQSGDVIRVAAAAFSLSSDTE